MNDAQSDHEPQPDLRPDWVEDWEQEFEISDSETRAAFLGAGNLEIVATFFTPVRDTLWLLHDPKTDWYFEQAMYRGCGFYYIRPVADPDEWIGLFEPRWRVYP